MNIVNVIAETACNWLASDSHWRKRAIAEAPEPTGFSPEMIDEAVTLTFSALTHKALRKFIIPADAPRRITHILSGNVPAPGIGSICRGLLLGAENLVKCSSRDPVFPSLFVESLREVNTELAERVIVKQWPREDVEQTKTALTGANAVIAYGDDDSIANLRTFTPATTQFYGYGHKISFAIVGEEARADHTLPALAAFDASVYDQQGCMSPHAFFVEGDAQAFAEKLTKAMEEYQQRVPRGRLSIEEAALSTRVREMCEFRGAQIWTGKPPHPWTVIYDAQPVFTPSCLNRTVFVKPMNTFNSTPAWTGKISTIGIAPWNAEMQKLTGDLAERICPIGQMQRPPFTGN